MVKRTITITTILLIISMVTSLIIVLNKASFAADDDIASGTSGTCNWVIDKDGVLTISPTNGESGVLANYYNSGDTQWNPYRERISKVIANTGVKANTNSVGLFYNLKNCTEMDLTGLDTSNTTKMSSMFYNCSALTSLDVTGLNTSKVTDMYYMFYGCTSLTNLNLIGFDTSKVTRMESMFGSCKALTSIDVTGFNTSNVTTMEGMFSGCNVLTSIDVTGFNTSKVTTMARMFKDCESLTNLEVSGFDTSNVKSMYGMFWGCSNLTNLNVTRFNTSKVTSMYYMFCRCEKLTNLDVTSFNTSNVITMGCMFGGCEALTSIDVTGFDTSSVTTMGSMFSSCENLTSIDLSNFNTSNLSGDNAIKAMFYGCFNIERLDLNHFNTSAITNFERVFCSCVKLEQIDVKNWNVSNGTNFESTFEECNSLTSLDLSGWETSSATKMTDMFRNCSSLRNINISNFDTSNVTDMKAMFAKCSSLETIDISSFDTRNVTNFFEHTYGKRENLFGQCNSLNKIVLGEHFDFDGNNITSDEYKAIFPSTNNPIYTNRWVREDKLFGPYTQQELRENYDGSLMAGAWIREIKKLKVTYSYTGTIPQGASDLPEERTYLPGDEVIVAPDATAPGYSFSGWNRTGSFEMSEEDVEITGYFIKDDVAKEYNIEYYFDGEKDDSLDETINAEINQEVSIDPQSPIMHQDLFYTLVSKDHKIVVSENAEDNIIRVYYETDVLDYNNEDANMGDGISDKYQVKIVCKVQNGKWNDGTSEDKKQIINLYDNDGNLDENGIGEIKLPEVGNKPTEGYIEGSWNNENPIKVSKNDNGKEFVYTYAKIGSVSKIEGNISNPKTDDIVQRYSIYGGAAIIVMFAVIRLRNKYSRKKKKIQF